VDGLQDQSCKTGRAKPHDGRPSVLLPESLEACGPGMLPDPRFVPLRRRFMPIAAAGLSRVLWHVAVWGLSDYGRLRLRQRAMPVGQGPLLPPRAAGRIIARLVFPPCCGRRGSFPRLRGKAGMGARRNGWMARRAGPPPQPSPAGGGGSQCRVDGWPRARQKDDPSEAWNGMPRKMAGRRGSVGAASAASFVHPSTGRGARG
jgi:hypothetical protein